ncbi:polyprenyl synthetase family protein [Streptomyces sp. NPDC093510]|uniref:polyprenyl synthetase family protein n=1 Tax=Streptomyces sp. NPDC093510 TaxID=3155199 RepID=UPI003412E2CB
MDHIPERKTVDIILDDFLAGKKHIAERTRVAHLLELFADFLANGERIRTALTVLGWQAAGGHGDSDRVARVAAALEMFHAFALIHDDLMDESDTRRGRPTLHRALAERAEPGRAEHSGNKFALLLGDLAFTWSDELLHTADLTAQQLRAVLPLIVEMRSEVLAGQYLDLRAAGELTDDVDATMSVNRYKTAKYTVERPLHIGAALAGAGPEAMAGFSAYALPLGEASRLRDDLLGVYGDVGDTGKSHLDDLRSGKNTTLLALALRAARPAQAARLRTLLGDPLLDETGAAEVRAVCTATGARRTVERMIDDRRRQALRALDTAPFDAGATTALKDLAHTATRRSA